MCKTFSGFSTEHTAIHWDPGASDSHETLADLLGVTRDPLRRVQWEFYPEDNEWGLPDHYVLHTDQDMIPAWWDAAHQEKVATELRERVARMVRADKCKVLAGGPWILGDGFEAQETANCQIAAVGKSAKVNLGKIAGSVAARNIFGSVTTGDVCGSVTTGVVDGSVTTGYGDVCGSVVFAGVPQVKTGAATWKPMPAAPAPANKRSRLGST